MSSPRPNKDNVVTLEMITNRVQKLEMEVERLQRLVERNQDVSPSENPVPPPPAPQPQPQQKLVSYFQPYLDILNTGNLEDLRKLQGIGAVRAQYVLEERAKSSEPPFKHPLDLEKIGVKEYKIIPMIEDELKKCLAQEIASDPNWRR